MASAMRNAGLVTLALLLGGCANLMKSTDDSDAAWEKRQQVLEQIDRFTLNARVASGGVFGIKGNLIWNQRPDDFDMAVSGPFGIGAVSLSGTPQEVTVRSKSGTSVTPDPEAYLKERLGWTFPVEGLRYWVLGLPSPLTDAEIEAAARAVSAHEFITRLPGGYEFMVDQRGGNLSLGQRQLLSFARALVADTKILILDEFTSGIDTESENLITEAIERIMRGRTSLVIAHRLNTIRHADRIIVLDSGKIVEEGTHQRLLDKNGLYTKLYEAQLRTPVGLLEQERKGA